MVSPATRELRVLHVINGLGTGGAERSLAEMLPYLARAGIASRIVCLSRKPEGLHATVERSGVPVDVVGTASPSSLLRIRRIIRDWRPHVVHTSIFEADLLGSVAALGTGSRVLSSLVNTTYDGARLADAEIGRTRLAAVKAANRLAAHVLTDHFHAISPAVRDSAARHLGIRAERITVVERGRDESRLGGRAAGRRDAVRAALGVPPDAEVVLNVGRQEPQKGQLVLLRAVADLARERPRLLLVQAGRSGKATPSLHRFVSERGIADRTLFLGHRDDVGDLLAMADVFAFPSYYEGLGGSLLEAMATGVPAVVSEAPALVDAVEGGRGGVVVPVGDHQALATALRDLLDNPGAAADLAGRAREIFLERFTLERSMTGMIDLFRRVAAD